MLFWWICGGESVLPVLLLRHLGSSPPSVYSWHLFLISSASVRSLPILSFIVTILEWNAPLISPLFLKRSLVFPILLFSSISFYCSLKKTFLSLLAILCNCAFSWVYLSFSPLLFTSLHSYLLGLLIQPFGFFAFLFHGDGLDPCLLYK